MTCTTTPNVTAAELFWASMKDKIFLTIMLKDCSSDYDLKISEKDISFSAKNKTGDKEIRADLHLYAEIDAEKYKKSESDRSLQLCFNRKEPGDCWPRLLETKAKMHNVKVDFDRWDDDSDAENEDETANWESMMNNMNIGDRGMEDEGSDIEDSDDDDLPDLEDDKDMNNLE